MILFLGATVSLAQRLGVLWTRTYGGARDEKGYSVQQTFDGGYIISGETESFGAGLFDVYLVKTDSNGDSLWAQTYGGTGYEFGYSVAQTSDSGYIIAGVTTTFGSGGRDVYLIRTNRDGDVVWRRAFGGTDHDAGTSVQETSDGEFIVVGTTYSSGAGGADVYLLKIDANGDSVWAKTYGGTDSESGWSVRETSGGGYIIVGQTMSFGAGDKDVYIIKTDSLGDSLWARFYGGADDDRAFSVQQTSDGGYIMTGRTFSFGSGGADIYLLKTDEYGDTIWTRTYGGLGNDEGNSVVESSDSGYVIAGYTFSFTSGSNEVYLFKTSVDGESVWAETYGGSGDDIGSSVQETSDGNYIIAGYTSSFGAGSLDVYLIKTEPGVGIEVDAPCNEASLMLRVEPNPFRRSTVISYSLPAVAQVTLEVYDLSGRLVKVLVDNETVSNFSFDSAQDLGYFPISIFWDGTDGVGRRIPSGVYFLRFNSEEYNVTRKLLLVR